MISRHRKYKFFTRMLLALILCIPHTVLSLAPSPVNYLMPPPPPHANALTRLKPARPHGVLPSDSRTVPKHNNKQPLIKSDQQEPDFMARVARWFGFTNENAATDQQLGEVRNKQTYLYSKPQHQQQYSTGDKEPCSLCSKYPWVPMGPNSIHHIESGSQWDATKQFLFQDSGIVAQNSNSVPSNLQTHLQNYLAISGAQPQKQINNAASNIKQRAIKFNYPFPYVPQVPSNKLQGTSTHVQYSPGPFLPIPIHPVLSSWPMPPLYNAQNFLSTFSTMPNTIQQLPSTKAAYFAENQTEYSKTYIDTVVSTQIPPSTSNNDGVEIIKSHQLVDYISSVEYPASFVPSSSVDINTEVPLLPSSHQPDAKISTGLYQHATLSPHLNQHVPASQILTDPGSFQAATSQQPTPQPDIYEYTAFSQPQFLKYIQNYEHDNYVAASHQNSSVLEQQSHTNLDTWTLESNDYAYATSTPRSLSTTFETATFQTEFESTTSRPQQQDNEVEFIASIQTSAQHSNTGIAKLWPQKNKQRETPKRLLDSPIQHSNNNFGAPRPFTKDPSDLTFRLLEAKNHKFPDLNPAMSSHEQWTPQIASPASPTPTSNYSSLDASGQYAGMSPPSLPSSHNRHQISLPHLTIQNQPRPFKTTRQHMTTKSPSTTPILTWGPSQNTELHTPQESMLVKNRIIPAAAAITDHTTVRPRTTKYLTKVLASNLKELLQREHEPTKIKLGPNSFNIDIMKLQRNIDIWTEQEYTSLTHKPSTPTIYGRSKHIPSEYLPTTKVATQSTRQPKLIKNFIDSDKAELPSSINNLEPLYKRKNSKHIQYTSIPDNEILDLYGNFEALKSKPLVKSKTVTPSTTSTSTTTTTTTTTTEKPFTTQQPEELWKKAKVSISPKTQEKVYVVTPQPLFFPQRFYSPAAAAATTTTTTTTTEKSSNIVGNGFKSPRFLVRPTPGNAIKLSKISDTESKGNFKETLSNSFSTPDWFGLRGVSAYVPSEPVEIIDGNSKVLTIVTPPSNLETTTHHNVMDLTKNRYTASKRKSTMAPSPR